RPESDFLPPLSDEILLDTLRLLHRGQAMGIITEADDPANKRLTALLEALNDVRVGTELTASLQQILRERKLDHVAARNALRQLYSTLGENPLPHREWRSLLRYFSAEQLGVLLGASASSVQRYANQQRTTPEQI